MLSFQLGMVLLVDYILYLTQSDEWLLYEYMRLWVTCRMEKIIAINPNVYVN